MEPQRSVVAHGHGNACERTPAFAGARATDPFRIMVRLLAEVRDAGFAGVRNFPAVGLIDGGSRRGLEGAEIGSDREVAMIAHARAMGLLDLALTSATKTRPARWPRSVPASSPARRPDDQGDDRGQGRP